MVWMMLWQGVISEAQAQAQTSADMAFATVHRLRGEVKAAPPNGPQRILREGDKVMTGEKLTASANAEAVLRTMDSGMVAVRPGAEFVVQGFSAKGDKSDSMVLRIITGSLRVITGWIGRTNPGANQIATPSATIGIRGTDHEPYVLTTDKPSDDPFKPHRAGTYDKVNRGGTSLASEGVTVDIDPGKAGFAPAGASTKRKRAIMTLLLPQLLDKVPDFYVPGEFDAELDKFSESADALAQKDLEQRLGSASATTSPLVAPPATAPKIPETPTPATAIAAAPTIPTAPITVPYVPGKCVPDTVAAAWVSTLDSAIHRKDPQTILGLFADDVKIKAVVRKKDGSLSEMSFTRDELVRSTMSTINQLEGYQHRRISVDAKRDPAFKKPGCGPILVKSVVIEQGRLGDKPYRFESTEDYELTVRDGKWLATKAGSAQR